MGILDKLLGRNKEAKPALPAADSNKTFYILKVNARLQPMHRGEIYEDPLEERLGKAGIGSISGGGTFLSKEKEITGCDIEICLNDDSEECLQKLMAILNELSFPKGSDLSRCTGEEEIPLCQLGNLEGLALYLNGTDLPNEVYESCDINHVISETLQLLGDTWRLFSWREGESETALYFYGEDFAESKLRIEPFLDDYPLCQKCRVEQIA
ncbi:hypothetical protein LJC07_00735 [Christensenellaceae bacterium OttesenSCG-928-L17]|nr:hypothetical protein [Christensenellaceae bacterium OttesenSCG-928-L17]